MKLIVSDVGKYFITKVESSASGDIQNSVAQPSSKVAVSSTPPLDYLVYERMQTRYMQEILCVAGKEKPVSL